MSRYAQSVAAFFRDNSKNYEKNYCKIWKCGFFFVNLQALSADSGLY